MRKIAIIGAGASGLFLAQKLSRYRQFEIHVFEKAKLAATKLRASGGGKANIFNMNLSPDCYNRETFMKHFLQQVDGPTIRQEFVNLGLTMTTDEEGRVYPSSQFAQTVVDVLMNNCKENVHFHYEFEVLKVWREDDYWKMNDFPVLFDIVILASGSPANMILKNRKDYNHYLTDFNLKTNEIRPSLVGFKIKNAAKELAGCRTKAIAALYQHNKLIHKEMGEVLFKEDGISGIVILNLSAYYNRLKTKEDCSIGLNFIYFDKKFNTHEYLNTFHSLRGVLHPKLNQLYEKQEFDVKNYKLSIEEPYDLAYAQVCHGGIDLSEIHDNFMLKDFPNIYVTGEMLDVDGICGGYNLFFAFATAYVVGKSICD